MPHAIDTNGNLLVNLDDYNHILSVRHREVISKICDPLNSVESIKSVSLFINFNNGFRFAISNMPLWAIPYRTLGYADIDSDVDPIFHENESHFFHSKMAYGEPQKHILGKLKSHHNLAPSFALVRKCSDCIVIFEVYSDHEITNIEEYYKKNQLKVSKFCVTFIEDILDIIKEQNRELRYFRFIYDQEYRRNVLLQVPTQEELSPREKDCVYWASLGKTAEETGVILNIAKKTVEKYLEKSKNRLNCRNTAHLVATCIRNKIIHY